MKFNWLRTFLTALVIPMIFWSCEPDPCKDVNCQNGGVCDIGLCECPYGFKGINCEIQYYPGNCGGVECLNGGECDDGTCDCPPGYFGESCELTNCDFMGCQNGGTCISGSCNCPEGFSGEFCEIDDGCADVNCLNGGNCVGGDCDCPPGYLGDSCQVENFSAFVGDYAAVHTCNGEVSGVGNYTLEITPTNDPNIVTVENMAGTASMEGTVTGNTMTLDLIVNLGGYDITGDCELFGDSISCYIYIDNFSQLDTCLNYGTRLP